MLCFSINSLWMYYTKWIGTVSFTFQVLTNMNFCQQLMAIPRQCLAAWRTLESWDGVRWLWVVWWYRVARMNLFASQDVTAACSVCRAVSFPGSCWWAGWWHTRSRKRSWWGAGPVRWESGSPPSPPAGVVPQPGASTISKTGWHVAWKELASPSTLQEMLSCCSVLLASSIWSNVNLVRQRHSCFKKPSTVAVLYPQKNTNLKLKKMVKYTLTTKLNFWIVLQWLHWHRKAIKVKQTRDKSIITHS